MGFCPWGCKESDTTEETNLHLFRDLCCVSCSTGLLCPQPRLSLQRPLWLWCGPGCPWPLESSQTGIKSASPALAGGFLNPGPPGKSRPFLFCKHFQ